MRAENQPGRLSRCDNVFIAWARETPLPKWTEQGYYGSGKQTEHLKGCLFTLSLGEGRKVGGGEVF